MGGRSAVGDRIVLSQLAMGRTVPTSASATIRRSWIPPARCLLDARGTLSEMERIGQPGHDGGGLPDIATTQRVRRTEIEPDAGDTRQEVHQLRMRRGEVHAVGYERHVLAPDVTAAECALVGDADWYAPASQLPANRCAVLRDIRHRDLVALDQLPIRVVRAPIELHIRTPL